MKNFLILWVFLSLTLWGSNFQVGADWLYWEAEQNQMLFFSEVAGIENHITSDPLLLQVDYNNGFRLFADYAFNACWHLEANLTHLPQHASVSREIDPADTTSFLVPDPFLYPIFQAIQTIGNFTNAGIDWSLNLYYFDIDISRSFLLCQCINLEPYFGLRAFWMNQAVSVDALSPGTGEGVVAVDARFQERDRGIGFQGGCDFICNLRWGFALVGLFGGSVVYTREKIGQSLRATVAEAPLLDINAAKIKLFRSMPSVESYLGLQYRNSICHHPFEIHVGWENHLFFHTNQFSITQDGSLTTQGLTLGGSLCF